MNIWSIRSVTTKPPTMLTVASTIATRPTTSATPSACAVTMIAPSRMTPWMALAPDISGVCSVEDTFEMTSMPTKTLSTKTVSQAISFTAGPRSTRPGSGPSRASRVGCVPDLALRG